jgi:S-adenosylmethionine:tRNA ribosyltransferase-isomerase
MHIAEFDYDLPEELIAQRPLERRDSSRMLVLDRQNRSWTDSQFKLLPEYLTSQDVLVVNNTRVFPARLDGWRDQSGGHVELLLLREIGPDIWQTLIRPSNRIRRGALIRFGNPGLQAEVLDEPGEVLRQVRFHSEESLPRILDQIGEVPLPPYIKRPDGAFPEDRERYQTVFAQEKGAVAAPTAGLHFTPETADAIAARGIRLVEITLHVGYGTFEPVRVEDVEKHRVAPESFRISAEAACIINSVHGGGDGGRVIAVGTTTTRALESATNPQGMVEPGEGSAELTITPNYEFKIIDALLTNFHLPRSSLLLLVCAFAGSDFTLAAYRHAVKMNYRFYSYGDCMFVI